MDKVLTGLKKLIMRSENDEPVPVDRYRVEDVRRIMAKTDPDNPVDADEMTQLVGASASGPKLNELRPVTYVIDSPVDRHRMEDVRQAMTKTDPDTLVDADEMTQLAGATAPAPKLDDIKPRPSKNELALGAGAGAANASPIAPSDAILTGLNVLQKPAGQAEDTMWEDQKNEEQNRDDGMPNPIEDDIFIYYD